MEVITAVFERSSNPMVLADDDRRYTEVNDAALKLLRFSREEFLKLKIDDITPPEGRDSIDKVWSSFLTTGTMSGTFDVMTSEGRLVTIDFNATANVTPGQHLSIFLVPPPPGQGGNTDEDEGAASGVAGDSNVTLRPRETEVLTRLALGDTGERIAADLGISKETVRVHIRNAMGTLGANTRAQAIGIAIRDKLIELP